MDARTVFSDPAQRSELFSRFLSKATTETVMRDTEAFLTQLGARVATTGYCLGGRFSLSATGRFPERIVAAASYHGGNLANDAADSPHLRAGKIKARVYVAGAMKDPSFPEEQKARLAQALREAGVDHLVETYPAKHGWVPKDTPVNDAKCAERHWQTLFALLESTLKKAA